MRRLHLTRSRASFPDHSRFGLPRLIFHGIIITHLPTCSFQYMPIPLLKTYFTAISLMFSYLFAVPLIISFFILSSLVTPQIHLNILIYITHIQLLLLCFLHCPNLSTVHQCCQSLGLYINAGLTPSCELSP